MTGRATDCRRALQAPGREGAFPAVQRPEPVIFPRQRPLRPTPGVGGTAEAIDQETGIRAVTSAAGGTSAVPGTGSERSFLAKKKTQR